MHLKSNTVFTSEQEIIDADCRQNDLILLLKGKGENIVQLNGERILHIPSGHHMIRLTKKHFCLLYNSTLSFYSLSGDFIFETDVGPFVRELFPYKDGVLCIYSDEGVFGEGLGRNILNYVAPFQHPQSFLEIANRYNLLYDALFTRFKPYACLDPKRNELVLLDEQLAKVKTFRIPFHVGNVITFATTYKNAVFIEEDKIVVWELDKPDVVEYKNEFSNYIKAIYHRHEYLFMEITNHEIRFLKPVCDI